MNYKYYKFKQKIATILIKFLNFRKYFSSKKLLVKSLPEKSSSNTVFLIKNGYLKIDNKLDLSNELLLKCQNIIKRFNESHENKNTINGKKFLFNILSEEDIKNNIELLYWGLNSEFLKVCSRYFNDLAKLSGLYLFKSPITHADEFDSSRLFHLDMEREKQIKVFYLLHETHDEHGPFEYVNLEKSQDLMIKVDYDGKRISDKYINKDIDNLNLQTFKGPAGKGLMIDTSNCIHRGSRNVKKCRYVLMFQYFPLFSNDKKFNNRFNINKFNLNFDKLSTLAKNQLINI